MSWRIRPAGSLGTPGVGAVNGHGQVGYDGDRKLATHLFGYYPDGSLAPNPGQSGAAPYLHWGSGRRADVCAVSGELFPESRLVRQWDGRRVGDVYRLDRPRTGRPRRL